MLPDGSVVHIRPIEPDDGPLLRSAFERLGPESRYRRFLYPAKELGDRQLTYFTNVDHRDHEALIALDPHSSELVGVARYVRTAADRAEVAIAVVDDWQGRGLGTALVHELVEAARGAGIRHFTATCLAENRTVIDLLERIGPTRVDHPDQALVELDIALAERGTTHGELYDLLRHAAAGRLEVRPRAGPEHPAGRRGQ